MHQKLKKIQYGVPLSVLIPGVTLFFIVSILTLLSLSQSALLDGFVTEARAGINLQRLGFESITPTPTPRRGALVDENFTPAPDSCRITLRFAQINTENDQIETLNGVSLTLVSLVNENNPQTMEAIANFEGEFFRTSSNMRSGRYRVSVQREGFQSQTVTINHNAPENCDHTIVLVRDGEDGSSGEEPTNTPAPSRRVTPTRTPSPTRANTPAPERRSTPTPRPDNSETCPLVMRFADASNPEETVGSVNFILDQVVSQNPLNMARVMDVRDFDEGVVEVDPAENGQYRIVAWRDENDMQQLTFTHAGNICEHQIIFEADSRQSENDEEGRESDEDGEDETGNPEDDTDNPDEDGDANEGDGEDDSDIEVIPPGRQDPGSDGSEEIADCRLQLNFEFNRDQISWVIFSLNRLPENREDEPEEIVSREFSWGPTFITRNPVPNGRYVVSASRWVFLQPQQWLSFELDHRSPENCIHPIELNPEAPPREEDADETGNTEEPEDADETDETGDDIQNPEPSNTPETPTTPAPPDWGGTPGVTPQAIKPFYIQNDSDTPVLVSHLALEQPANVQSLATMSLETNFTVPPRSRSQNIGVLANYCEQFQDRIPAGKPLIFKAVYIKGEQRINFWKAAPGFLKFNWESKPEATELSGSQCDAPETPAIYTVK